eukprot:TRINITY_DN8320_c0_g1_i1.p1 TRINITY_DN8320_c0_g1~~TRINITY_DN8320_c0_g1_i1.p1  ORF type:complete len:442 (-),score=86.14 TRINITY_DN8320_c0_g1_i1:90-1340(-)
MWFGVTEGWLVDTPNPVEIAGAIDYCKSLAQDQQLGGQLYLAGHSLGGVMLEQYLQDQNYMATVDGVILLGSYLTDFLFQEDNNYAVPALTLIGSLDGLSLTYAYREWIETQNTDIPEMYPVIVAADVNHAQVGSGEVPSFVKERDIAPVMEEAAAHQVYASIVAAFIVTQNQDIFEGSVVAESRELIAQMATFTETFLTPFRIAHAMEAEMGLDNWMIRGQQILTGLTESEGMVVDNLIVPFDDLGETKPSVEMTGDCAATIKTYSTPNYDLDVFDAGVLISASVIKAKFKLEDVVRDSLCVPIIERRQCKDINKEAYEVALEMASEDALQRFQAKGTKLFFLDDSVSPWGPGWEYSLGLHYNRVNETHSSMYATSLISEPDFFIQSAAGMHYCDLLSPYRALEWVYITSVVGKY